MKQLVQCRLQRGTSTMTAWIDKGAVVGKVVELLPSREMWTVVSVGMVLDEIDVKEFQRVARRGLPSLDRQQRASAKAVTNAATGVR